MATQEKNNSSIVVPSKFPWLMLVETEDQVAETRSFFGLCDGNVFQLNLPEACSGKKCGGSHGWLITKGLDLEINVLNPLTRTQIRLPPITAFLNKFHLEHFKEYGYSPEDFRDVFINKVVLSSTPSDSHDFAVMVIFGRTSNLAFTKSGDESWTDVEAPTRSFDDVTCYKGQFYAVDCHGTVVYWDEHDVTSGKPVFRTIGFKLFKLDESAHWVEVNSLTEDEAVFLGTNTSVSVSISDFPGCKGSCIYFRDDNMDFYDSNGGGGKDMGVFSFKDNTIEAHYSGQSLSLYSPPVWIVPSN
ncbi:hypothetical protein GIB67_008231 [Kingdonia uniflora]|uniref:KIB1-4 beta-propeller domain-containing protein n=1 Tax=Kingdonia uniflora TaxID=39325 RepID=A0A7J7N4Y5_9MAGN|nr:hypothetical protein GIB67_008231 [Kingdonia uniflora]